MDGTVEEPRSQVVYLILDTNILLHFRPISDINWSKETGAAQVFLAVAPVVFRELDHLKDNHAKSTIRQRAYQAAKQLELYAFGQSKLGFQIYLCPEPRLDFLAHGLNSDVNDDHLLASMLELVESHPNCRVCLVANDVGPRIKARQRSLELFELDKKHELPAILDDLEKEKREMQKTILDLQSRIPKLALRFNNDLEHLQLVAKEPCPLDIPATLQKLRAKYQRIERPEPVRRPKEDPLNDARVILGGFGLAGAFGSGQIPDSEYHRYNQELEEFFLEYELYLPNVFEHRRKTSLCFEINLVIANLGKAPAEDIDIHLHFPDGFELHEGDFSHPPPKQPYPPVAPQTDVEMRTARLTHGMRLGVPDLRHLSLPPLLGPSNVSEPSIKKSNSYDVDFHVRRLKQHTQVDCNALQLAFESFESASSFTIDYSLNCADSPTIQDGKLHVRVIKE